MGKLKTKRDVKVITRVDIERARRSMLKARRAMLKARRAMLKARRAEQVTAEYDDLQAGIQERKAVHAQQGHEPTGINAQMEAVQEGGVDQVSTLRAVPGKGADGAVDGGASHRGNRGV